MLPTLQAVATAALSASAAVSGGACHIAGIFVTAASAGPAITLYDNSSASGPMAVATFTPVPGVFYPVSANCRTGCFLSIAGTVTCYVFTNAPDPSLGG
jgi:hypothetical protein